MHNIHGDPGLSFHYLRNVKSIQVFYPDPELAGNIGQLTSNNMYS